ncbi:MAG: hypothetical protein C0501_07815 [Isosphaera sp.]|nr:hypothetical protein [Isosphaera sp.]
MPTPDLPPDDFPPELLAAYADGELDADTRAAVERWLADHPEARAELDAQRAFSPANGPLWESAEPPEPPPAAWAAVRGGIGDRLDGPIRYRGRAVGWVAGGLAAAAVAASAAWLALAPVAPPEARDIAVVPAPVPAPSEDPLTGFAVLPMAGDDDVTLDRVPDTRAGWLPVGRHPLDGALALVAAEELEVEDADPSPAWPAGGPKLTAAPGDAPMIFAAKPR